MSKIVCEYEFGESVIVVRRTIVQDFITLDDGSVELITDDGIYNSEDPGLIGIFPDPED